MFVELKAAFCISIQAVEIEIDQNARSPLLFLLPFPPSAPRKIPFGYFCYKVGGIFWFFGENT